MTKAITVENVSKEYRLGAIGHGMLYQDLQSWWARIRGKEDPNSRVDYQENIHSTGASALNERFWALRDISFDVDQGEILGIIGRNGAGKSTLLKILSRVTSPTTGTVKLKGRLASLLEVGTGFHPELTGRENVYLNGAILGMTKQEITGKFDEIVDFSGIEKFIDTPVKRYSSGMYVRLAFAVAAHLQSEILIIDEVLAVGDAEFQKKCFGKMHEVGRSGKTVLFVSHNMGMMATLCDNLIMLNKGQLVKRGPAQTIINEYMGDNTSQSPAEFAYNDITKAPGDHVVRLVHAKLVDDYGDSRNVFLVNEDINVEIRYRVLSPGHELTPNIHVYWHDGTLVFISSDTVIDMQATQKMEPGLYVSRCRIPRYFLNTGMYSIGIAVSSPRQGSSRFYERDLFVLRIDDQYDNNPLRGVYASEIPGVVRPMLEWRFDKVE